MYSIINIQLLIFSMPFCIVVSCLYCLYHNVAFDIGKTYIAIYFILLCHIVIVQRFWSRTTSGDHAQSYENSFKDSFRIGKRELWGEVEKTRGRILRAALSIREALWQQTQIEELIGRLIKLICSINTSVKSRASLLHVCPPQRSSYERSYTMSG